MASMTPPACAPHAMRAPGQCARASQSSDTATDYSRPTRDAHSHTMIVPRLVCFMLFGEYRASSNNCDLICMWLLRGAEYCNERVCLSVFLSVSVCLCFCLSAIIFSELQVRSSNFLGVAVARSSSSGVVTDTLCISGLWMSSYLLISQGCPTSPPS